MVLAVTIYGCFLILMFVYLFISWVFCIYPWGKEDKKGIREKET